MDIDFSKIEKIEYWVPNSKGNIVFLHGFTSNFNSKLYLKDELKNYNFFAINLPCHGETPSLNNKDLTVENFAKIWIKYLKKNKLENIILYGHSMGGALAAIIANKLKQKVKKVILEGPANSTVLNNYEMISKFIPNTIDDTKYIFSNLFYEPLKIFGSQATYDRIINIEFNNLSTKYKDLNNMLDQKILTKSLKNVDKHLLKIEQKTLAILGKYDQIVPTEATHKLLMKNPNIEIKIIHNSKHNPSFEQKKITFDIINEFLKK